MARSQRDVLYEIMRQASYLPAHSDVRATIEAAASEALRTARHGERAGGDGRNADV